MLKLKGIGRFKIELSKIIAKYKRNRFILNCEKWQFRILNCQYETKCVDVISISGHSYFPEQLLSIYNFIKYFGIPNRWVIIDDGTYTERELTALKRFEFVTILNSLSYQPENFSELMNYAEKHVWVRLVCLYFNLLEKNVRTTLFVEADVLIGPKIKDYIHLFDNKNWHLADTGPHFDTKYYDFSNRKMFDVNNGFAIFNSVPNLQLILDYMVERLRRDEFEYFTPQSAFQLAINTDVNSSFLDPRYFVVSVTDMFKIGCDFKSENLAVRHFVGPCRHKMWQYKWD